MKDKEFAPVPFQRLLLFACAFGNISSFQVLVAEFSVVTFNLAITAESSVDLDCAV